MGLANVAGIFSRKFIVGFFVPVFFAAFALSRLVDARSLPGAYREAGGATQVLVIGAFALLVGLLLSGVHFSLIRLLEGYWLIRIRVPPPEAVEQRRLAMPLRRWMLRVSGLLDGVRLRVGQTLRRRWIERRTQLIIICEEAPPSAQRTAAAMELHRRFPASEATVLPTEFGNAIRAFETHPRPRYGLDGIAVWPRISTMLSDGERTDLEEATTDLAFWVNALTVIALGGVLLCVERLWHRPGGPIMTLLVELGVVAFTVLASWWAYRQAISAAARWGDPVRAAFDVHRFQLFDSLGIRRPASHAEDVIAGDAANRMLWFAEPIPDDARAGSTDSGRAATHGDGLASDMRVAPLLHGTEPNADCAELKPTVHRGSTQ